MTGFLVGAAVVVALVLTLVLRPFLRKTAPVQPSQRELNKAIFRDQLAKLDQDLADGTLGNEDYTQARAELQRRVLEDTRAEDAASMLRAPRRTMVALALVVPLVAGAVYLMIGNPRSVDPTAAARPQMPNAEELDKMVAALAQKLEKEPNNSKGWAMLARSYKVMGRSVESERAFERAGAFIDNDAQMLASYADVVASNNGGSLAGKPAMLIQKALKADPDNATALWLSGTADLEAKNYPQTLRTWELLAGMLQPGSDDARKLQDAIDDVRARSSLPVAKAPGGAAPAGNVSAAAAGSGNVSGTVELDSSLNGKAGPTTR